MEFLNYSEAARFLGVPLGTLYALVARKAVPHVRLGPRLVRFERARLARWVAEHAVETNTSAA